MTDSGLAVEAATKAIKKYIPKYTHVEVESVRAEVLKRLTECKEA